MPSFDLLDAALAPYDMQQATATLVRAAPQRVFAALAAFDPQSDKALRAAFALHDAPAVLCAPPGSPGMQARSLSRLGPLEQSAMASRWPSDSHAGELVLGFVGKFWWPLSPIAMPSLEEFRGWDKASVTKVAWGFTVSRANKGGTTLGCELRAKSMSMPARLAFHAYWRLVEHASGALRRHLLHHVKLAAEAA